MKSSAATEDRRIAVSSASVAGMPAAVCVDTRPSTSLRLTTPGTPRVDIMCEHCTRKRCRQRGLETDREDVISILWGILGVFLSWLFLIQQARAN